MFNAIFISQPLLADIDLPPRTNPSFAPQITQHSVKPYRWISISTKQALVCDVDNYRSCINSLPIEVVEQLPSKGQISSYLGHKAAMVLPVTHDNVAGIIIVSVKQPLFQTISSINGMTYQLELEQQLKQTLWHEIGHLENIALLGGVLPASLTAYQHEWLADVYLVWRIAREHQTLDLAWQQFHRRNMDLINDSNNMSHWSSPQLQWVMAQYQLDHILEFNQYSEFISSIFPALIVLGDTERSEISSLVQRTFGSGVTQALPKYMFWRQERFIDVISPTLIMLMGEEKAQTWLVKQFSEAEKMLKETNAE